MRAQAAHPLEIVYAELRQKKAGYLLLPNAACRRKRLCETGLAVRDVVGHDM